MVVYIFIQNAGIQVEGLSQFLSELLEAQVRRTKQDLLPSLQNKGLARSISVVVKTCDYAVLHLVVEPLPERLICLRSTVDRWRTFFVHDYLACMYHPESRS